MTYKVEFSRRAEKQFEALSKQIQIRLQSRIDELALYPRPPSARKLEGIENQYRVRVGDYRIIYEIQDSILLVILVRIGHRSEVYRKQ